MKRKHNFKAALLLTTLCMVSGCQGSTESEAEMTTMEIPVITATETTAEQTTITTTDGTFFPKYEVDHIDNNDIYIYKNPEVWTYEKLFENLTINGKTFEAPLTLEKLGEGFSIDYNDLGWIEEERLCAAQLFYNGTEFALVRFAGVDSADELYNAEIDIIFYTYPMHTSESNLDILKINNVGLGTSREKIEASFGIPYGEQEWIVLYFGEGLHFQFGGFEPTIEKGETSWVMIRLSEFPKENQQ